MAVATKKRRRLIRENRLFIWHVLPDEDSTDCILHVFSDDKRFMVHYVLGQNESRALVVVIGKEFAGAETGGCWTRFRCPSFDKHGVIGPGGVRCLIDWCLSEDRPRQLLDVGEFPSAFYGSQPDVAAYRASTNRTAGCGSDP